MIALDITADWLEAIQSSKQLFKAQMYGQRSKYAPAPLDPLSDRVHIDE